MISKFLKALFEFLFKQHGFLPFERFTGSQVQMQQVSIAQKMAKGKPKQYKCKICEKRFWALKNNPTCRNLACFFIYRIRRKEDV